MQEHWAQSAHPGMGTEITHRAYGRHASEALLAAQAESQRLEGMLSRFLPHSDISRINRCAGIGFVNVQPETMEILSQSLTFSQALDGCFDITVGPLVDLWDYKHALCAPDIERIRGVLPFVDHTKLVLNSAAQTARLQKRGQSIDLGGVAKGRASDRFMEIFRKFGVRSAYSNIGGNVSTLGGKPDGSPWRVGIRHPRQEGGLLGAVAVKDKAVVTSGDYERYFIDPSGRRYHHILDPSTGYPAESRLVSVTVVADSAMAADALSTALFVAGMDKGLKLLEGFRQAGAVFADTSLTVFVTPGLQACFQASEGIRTVMLGNSPQKERFH